MRFLALLPLFLLASCLSDTGAAAGADQEGESPPNILFILTDDQGIGDLSLHGNDSIRTPNMDRLLTEGAKFDRFYVSPVCAPTRASFLSGLYAPRTGAVYVTRRRETMAAEVKTIPEYLREAGYRTGLFGKWHNGATKPYDPAGQGFDEFLGFSLGHFNDYFNGELENERNEAVPFSGDLTQILTDTAAAFMLADLPDPFFCMLTYQAPHTPVQVADKYWNEVKKRGLTDYNTGIYAMIESIDDRIGQLLDRLEAAGTLDNTIIVFSTDNGPNGDRYRMGLKGTKGHIDEGGVRVPFAIRLPEGHPANGRSFDVPAAHIDLLPTLLELAGRDLPTDIDGISLLHYLNGGSTMGDVQRPIYVFRQGYDYNPNQGSMRDERYLYVRRSTERHELYDLQTDPGQIRDLWPEAGILGQDYRERYEQFAGSIGRPDRIAPPIDLDAGGAVIHLLAHEGEPLGNTHFSDEYGWANDWFVNVDSNGAQWPITTSSEGTYQVTVKYHAEQPIRIGLQVDSLDTYSTNVAPTVTKQLPVADRVPRKEVYPRTWKEYTFDAVTIPAGAQNLHVFGGYLGEVSTGLWVKEVMLRRY